MSNDTKQIRIMTVDNHPISVSLIAFSQAHDPWASVLLVSFGIALALLSPGSWFVDARRSGWKRIEIRPPDN